MANVTSFAEVTYNKIKNVNEKNTAVEVMFKLLSNRTITKILIDSEEDREWILEANTAKKTFYQDATFGLEAVVENGNTYVPVTITVKLDDGLDLVFATEGQPNAIPISADNLNLIVKNINLALAKSSEIKDASIKIKRWEGVQ